MIVGFTGTRQIQTVSLERLELLEHTLWELQLNNVIAVIHGCAKGADTYFHKLCTKFNFNISGYPAINSKNDLSDIKFLHLPQTPLKRNRNIVKDCDILIALPIDKNVEELRSGTWATIRYARKLNKKIIMI